MNSGLLLLAPSLSAVRDVERAAKAPAPTGVVAAERDGGDQQLLRSLNWTWSQLPLGLNANRALCMPEREWSRVSMLHLVNGYEYHKRTPVWIDTDVRTFWAR